MGQEIISPATFNTAKLGDKKASERYMPKSGELITLPFVDDFSTDNFPGNTEGNEVLWQEKYATLNTGLPVSPPTVGVVSFDGTDEVGYPYSFEPGPGSADTLTSCPIDLSYDPDDGVGLSFFYQPQGTSFFPPSSETDSLILEFYAPDLEQWFWAWSTADVSQPDEFRFVYVPITQERYLMEGFQFRFRNIAFLQGLYSVWNVDYVWLDQNEFNIDSVFNDVAFVDQRHSFLTDYTSMPLSHYAEDPEARMLQDVDVLFRNLNDGPRTLEGNAVRIFYEGSLEEEISNPNEPPIQAGSSETYTHTLEDGGGQYFFDPSLDDEELTFECEIVLGTVDQPETSTNNSIRFEQYFFTHYSYDDGSAEAGYGVSNNGSRVALRYTNFKSDSVWALRIYTMPFGIDFSNTSFTIKLWEDNGGEPGAEIGSASHQVVHGIDEYQQQIIYKFDEPVFVPSGSFFAGYQQSSQADGLRIGLDFNTAGNDGNLYFDDGNGWTLTVLAAEASLMIHPMFTTEGYQNIASTDNREGIPGLRVYPNPAVKHVFIESPDPGLLNIEIIDLSGRSIMRSQTYREVDLSGFFHGLYLIKITDDQGRSSVKKLFIGR